MKNAEYRSKGTSKLNIAHSLFIISSTGTYSQTPNHKPSLSVELPFFPISFPATTLPVNFRHHLTINAFT
jgi:hypothetical protein